MHAVASCASASRGASLHHGLLPRSSVFNAARVHALCLLRAAALARLPAFLSGCSAAASCDLWAERCLVGMLACVCHIWHARSRCHPTTSR